MFDLIASVLSFFYDQTGSYGVSVILLTLSVMIIVTPLTLSGTKSMIQMQRLQPEMKALQAKYKDDREELNREMMAFYQENGINPVGGCLPLFVQAPVFFVLYRVVSGLTRRNGDVGQSIGGFTIGGENAGQLPSETLDFNRNFNPEYLDSASDMARDLSGSDEMLFLGVDLADSALDALRSSLVDGLPYALMIVIVLVTSLYQQKQIKGRSNAAPVNPQQETIMKVLPWFLPVISFTLQAALVLYFIVSNLYRIGQQHYITRTLYGDEADDEQRGAKAVAGATKGGSSKKGGTKSDGANKSGAAGKSKQSNKKSDSTSSKRTTASATTRKAGGRQSGGGRTTPKGTTSNRQGPRREATVQPRPRKKKRK